MAHSNYYKSKTGFIFPHSKKTEKKLKSTWHNLSRRVWDPDTQLLFSREPLSVALIVSYYLVFWACLAAMFAVLLAFFLYIVIDSNTPTLVGMFHPNIEIEDPRLKKLGNRVEANPGMSFRPQPDVDSTLIRFVQGFPSSYQRHLDHMQAYLEQYEHDKQTGENYIDCQLNGRGENEIEKACRFDVKDLGSRCSWRMEYGYDEGSPCIMVKLNKLYGWVPELWANEDEAPEEIRKVWAPGYIQVTCEGETPVDKENIGNITMHPPQGLPSAFFPFVNQEGFRAPVVMVRFESPANGVVINVWCKAWAKNLVHHRYDRAASTHFELLID